MGRERKKARDEARLGVVGERCGGRACLVMCQTTHVPVHFSILFHLDFFSFFFLKSGPDPKQRMNVSEKGKKSRHYFYRGTRQTRGRIRLSAIRVWRGRSTTVVSEDKRETRTENTTSDVETGVKDYISRRRRKENRSLPISDGDVFDVVHVVKPQALTILLPSSYTEKDSKISETSTR